MADQFWSQLEHVEAHKFVRRAKFSIGKLYVSSWTSAAGPLKCLDICMKNKVEHVTSSKTRMALKFAGTLE